MIDPSIHEKLYRQEGRWDKYDWTYDGFSTKGSTIATCSHDIHKARRLPLSHFFSKAKVAARQDIIIRNVEKLCARVSGFSGSTVDLGAALSALSRDVACEFVLNKTYNSLGQEDFNVGMTNVFQDTGYIWRVTKHVPWFGPFLKSIPHSVLMKVADEGTKSFFSYTRARLVAPVPMNFLTF